jgi:hypothetical protein
VAGNRLMGLIQAEVERGYRLTGTIRTARVKGESRGRFARWMDYYGTRGLVVVGGYLILSSRLSPLPALAGAILIVLGTDYVLRRRQQRSLTRTAREKARKRMARQMLDALIAGDGPESEIQEQNLAKRLGWDGITRLLREDGELKTFLGQKGEQRYLFAISRRRLPAGSGDLEKVRSLAAAEQAQARYFISTSGFSEPAVRLAKSRGVQLADLSWWLDPEPAGEAPGAMGETVQAAPAADAGTGEAPAKGPDGVPGGSSAGTAPEIWLSQTLRDLITRSMAGLKSGLTLTLLSLLVSGSMRYYFLAFAAVNIGFSVYCYLRARRYSLSAEGPLELF